MSFNPPRTLQEAYTILDSSNKSVNKLINYTKNTFNIAKGVVRSVSEDRMSYEVHMIEEGIIITDAVLFLDKAYYQLVGFPNVGDVVKVFHKAEYSAAFIIARANGLLDEIVMDKCSAIPMGSNIP